jgi:hypothetical protein
MNGCWTAQGLNTELRYMRVIYFNKKYDYNDNRENTSLENTSLQNAHDAITTVP